MIGYRDPCQLAWQVNKFCKRRDGFVCSCRPLPARLAGEEVLADIDSLCEKTRSTCQASWRGRGERRQAAPSLLRLIHPRGKHVGVRRKPFDKRESLPGPHSKLIALSLAAILTAAAAPCHAADGAATAHAKDAPPALALDWSQAQAGAAARSQADRSLDSPRHRLSA